MPIPIEELKRRIAERIEAKKTMSPQDYQRFLEQSRAILQTQTVTVTALKGPGPQKEDYPELSLLEFEALPERMAVKEKAKEKAAKAREEYQKKVASGEIKPPPKAPERVRPKTVFDLSPMEKYERDYKFMKENVWSEMFGTRRKKAMEEFEAKYKPKSPD